VMDAHPDAPPGFVPFIRRINIAGPEFVGVDFPGTWAEDSGNGDTCTGSNSGPSTPPAEISGTVDDALFVKQVYGLPSMTCQITGVPNGNYDVTLVMGPVYYGTGATPACPFPRSQIFDIELEGQIVQSAYDLTADSNGCVANGGAGSHPVAKTFTIAITDGQLDILLTAPTGEASMLSALQLVQVP
jgi:Malectin domain